MVWHLCLLHWWHLEINFVQVLPESRVNGPDHCNSFNWVDCLPLLGYIFKWSCHRHGTFFFKWELHLPKVFLGIEKKWIYSCILSSNYHTVNSSAFQKTLDTILAWFCFLCNNTQLFCCGYSRYLNGFVCWYEEVISNIFILE